MEKPGTSGARGFTYETRICIFCFVSGFIEERKDFRLEYQVNEAGKFDDVVFHENGNDYQFIQLKHKEKDMKIAHAQLFNESYNGDYNLLKYIKSFLDIDSNEKFKNKTKCAVVFTNIDIDLKNGRLDLTKNPTKNAKEWYNELTELEPTEVFLEKETIINFSIEEGPKYYKFAGDKNFIKVLLNQAQFFKDKICETKLGRKKLNDQEKDLIEFVDNLTENKLKYALKYIIYAVKQPNDKDLEEIIKKQIEQKFAITNGIAIYSELELKFREWCDRKTGYFPPIIKYGNAKKFFQKDFKVIKFDVSAPTDFFTGRHDELDKIRNELLKTGNLIVSQTVAISGLGGVGKTETTRQFIKKYGDSDFYGRIVWISAENDKTVEESFKRLADKLKLGEKMYTQTIIEETFEYFNGFKVLFVFDNYDKNFEENLVAYCRKYASEQNSQNRPYFLFTSRDKNCLSGVSSIDLGMLAQNEAVELIKNHLKGIHDIEDIKELAQILHGFPLATRQAIAYINEKVENVLGKRYEVKHYLEEFETKKKELLSQEFEDEFKTQKQTTMITWNITLETIKKYEEGAICIKILKSLSYLYAEEIDVKIFFLDFKEDQIYKAIALLKRYCLVTNRNDSKIQIHRLVQVVIQEKFIKQKNEIVGETVRLVFPSLFYAPKKLFRISKKFPAFIQPRLYSLFLNRENHEKTFDVEQILHFNNIFSHLNDSFKNFNMYQKLYYDFNSKHLLKIVLTDNLENIKKIDDISLKFMVENYFKEIIDKNCVNFVQIAIEKGFTKDLDFSKSIKFYSTMNIEMFLLVFSKTDVRLRFSTLKISQEISQNFVQKTLNINISSLDGCTILHVACMQSTPDLQFIKSLVENGIDIDKKDKYDKTSVYYAMLRGHIEIAEYLLSFSKEKCEEDFEYAIYKDYPSIVEIFFDKHFERNHKFQNKYWGATPIKVAVKHLSIKTVFLMKSEFVELAKQKGYVNQTRNGETLLIKCINDEYFSERSELLLEYVKLFVENGVNVHDVDLFGDSAIFGAMDYKYDNIVTFLKKYLLKTVLRDNLEDVKKIHDTSLKFMVENHLAVIIVKNCNNFIKIAIEKGFIPIIFDPILSIKTFLSEFSKTRITPYATLIEAFPIPPEISQNFVQKTPNINILTLDGCTILHVACMYWTPDLQFIKSLVKNGIDIDKNDETGRTAVYYAIKNGHIEIAEYLLRLSKEKCEVDFLFAIEEDHSSLVEIFFDKYFERDHKFKECWVNMTPIEVAVRYLSIKTVFLMKSEFVEFAKQGGYVNNTNSLKETFLIKCIQYSNSSERSELLLEYVKLFVENGVNVHDVDLFGKSAISIAKQYKYDNIVTFLENYLKNFLETVLRDNLEEIKKIHKTSLKFMVENHFAEIIEQNCSNFVQVALEKGVIPIVFDPSLSIDRFLAEFPETKIRLWFPKHRFYTTQIKAFPIPPEISQNFVQKTPNINILTLDGCTILHVACMYWTADLQFIKSLVKNGIDIDKNDETGRTAVYYAIKNGHIEIAKLLLSFSKEKCEENLKCAIKKDYQSLVEIFFDKHFERDHKFEDGATPIKVAVKHLSIKTVFLMKSEYAELAKQRDYVNKIDEKYEKTLLIKCIEDEYFSDKSELLLKYVKLFVENGVNVHDVDFFGNSAISRAKDYKYDNIVTFLENNLKNLLETVLRDNLEEIKKIHKTSLKFMVENHFAEIIEQNCSNFVKIAIEEGFVPIIFDPTISIDRFLAEFPETEIRLWFPKKVWSTYLIKEFPIPPEISQNFVQKTPNINISTKDGCTILHVACMFCTPDLQFIKCLVENGIDIDKQGDSEITSIYCAIWTGHIEIAEYLVSLSKEKCEEDLKFAIYKDYPSIVEIFFDKHFERDHKFQNKYWGATPIKAAIIFLSVKIVFLMKSEFVEFAKQGGNVNQTRDDETLLIKCIKDKYFSDKSELILEYIKLFVENGVKVHYKDRSGKSAISYAKDYKYDNIVTFLENYNVKFK